MESGHFARSLDATEGDLDVISDLHLLTAKPILYVCNVDENTMKSGNKHVDAVRELVKDEDAEILLIEKTSKAMQLTDEPFYSIEEMGLEIPDDIIIMQELINY